MKTQDCFNWDSYTKSHYESEMSMLTKEYNLDFIIDIFYFYYIISIKQNEIVKFITTLKS
jgi:hypothetical protein